MVLTCEEKQPGAFGRGVSCRWMGDAGLSSNSFAINYDSGAFMDSYLVMMFDAQVRAWVGDCACSLRCAEGCSFHTDLPCRMPVSCRTPLRSEIWRPRLSTVVDVIVQ